MPQSNLSIAEENELKEAKSTRNLKSNHQRQPSDPTILNENRASTKNSDPVHDGNCFII
jgi:hypothetical protein